MKETKRIPQPAKRILEVRIKHVEDNDPDIRWLGEYSIKAEGDYSIDRRHTRECIVNDWTKRDKAKRILEHAIIAVGRYQQLVDGKSDEWEDLESAYQELENASNRLNECDCDGTDLDCWHCEYFNTSGNYKGEPLTDIIKYTWEDYERMEALRRCDWGFFGIVAEAKIGIGDLENYPQKYNCTVQTITSGGLYGIESDSKPSDIREMEKNELNDLKTQLRAIGFSTRAISAAFKNLKEGE